MNFYRTGDSSFSATELSETDGIVFTDYSSKDYIQKIATNVGNNVKDSAIKFGKELLKEILIGK